MGIEVIVDETGRERMVFDNDTFHNDDIIGKSDSMDDYEILQILTDNNFRLLAKVRSLANQKIYCLERLNVKDFKENEIESLTKEIDKIKGLEPHPNIIRYYDWFKEKDHINIIRDFASNGTFNDYINLHRKRDIDISGNVINDEQSGVKTIIEEDIWLFMKQMIDGLKFIHEKGIIHKDISPDNFFMTDRREIRYGDFGLKLLMDKKIDELKKCPPLSEEKEKTKKDKKLTPEEELAYFSPEVINNHEYDKESDIFSLGHTFREMIAMIDSNEKDLEKKIKEIVEAMKGDKLMRSAPFDTIEKNYNEKCVSTNGLNALVRGLYSIYDLTDHFLYPDMFDFYGKFEEELPFINEYKNCLKSIRDNDKEHDLKQHLIKLKKLIAKNRNINIIDKRDVIPNKILSVVLMKLDQESNRVNGLRPTSSLVGSKTEDEDIDKTVAFANFMKRSKEFQDSLIYTYLFGILQAKRICRSQAKHPTYSYSLFRYIEYDLEMMDENKTLPEWFVDQQNKYVELDEKYAFCPKCGRGVAHYEYKQWESMPKNLIININRGKNFRVKKKVKFEERMYIKYFGGEKRITVQSEKFNYTTYQLVGLINVVEKPNDNGYDFQVTYYDSFGEDSSGKPNWQWKNSKGEPANIEKQKNEMNDKVIMLFYSAIID